jgi:small-conductance mechanosensitive channel
VLQLRRPYTVGSEITIESWSGVVVDTGFRYVTIRQYDGTDVLLPARNVLQGTILNSTAHGARRTTVTFPIAYGTDLDVARQLLLDATSAVDHVLADPPPEAILTQFGPSAIMIDVRFWHDPQSNVGLAVRDRVMVATWSALDAAGIELARPQRIVQLHQR